MEEQQQNTTQQQQNTRKKSGLHPVRRVTNLAFDMKNYVANVKWGSSGQQMVIKIGIHYGRVMAGVIGFHKPQFSLIGDTVNTTSRVMSTGESGIITLSKQAIDELPKDANLGFTFKERIVEVSRQAQSNDSNTSVARPKAKDCWKPFRSSTVCQHLHLFLLSGKHPTRRKGISSPRIMQL